MVPVADNPFPNRGKVMCLSVAELRAALEGLPDDMPVMGYWDSHNWTCSAVAVEDVHEMKAVVLDVSNLSNWAFFAG